MPPRNHWPKRPPVHAAQREIARASRWLRQAARHRPPIRLRLFPAREPSLHFRPRYSERALRSPAWRATAHAPKPAGVCPAHPVNRWPKRRPVLAAHRGTAQAKLRAKARARRRPPIPPHQFLAQARVLHFRHQHRECRAFQEWAQHSRVLIIVARARKLVGEWPVPPGNRWSGQGLARAVPQGVGHPARMAAVLPLARRVG